MRTISRLCWVTAIALLGSAGAAASQGTITGLTLSPAAAETGATVTATATGSTAPCGAVHIDWGDGTAITYATEVLPVRQTHVYRRAGTFDLRAQGMGNCTGEAKARIVITAPPPPPPPPPPRPSPAPAPRLAGIELSAPVVEPRSVVAITLQGTGACRVTLDFGDGNSQDVGGTLPNTVRHTYSLAGRYSIVATPAPPCAERRVASLEVATRPAPRITGFDVAVPPDAAASMRELTIRGNGRCSYTIDYGDGNSETREGTLPDALRHNYPAEGRYTAVVTAQPPCTGALQSTFTVTRGVQAGASSEGSISSIDVRPQAARVGDRITVTVAGTGTCRFVVAFGDGESRTFTGRLPHRLMYQYARAGAYEIVVQASDPLCTGGGDALLRIRRR